MKLSGIIFVVTACSVFMGQALAKEIESKTTSEAVATHQDSKASQDSLMILITNLEKRIEDLNNKVSGLSDRVIKLEQQNKPRVIPLNQNAK